MRRTKEQAEQTRDNILNAAVPLFSDKGVKATTLNEIAKAAGVTRGAIYWHFENKTQIFAALHERLQRSFLELILEDLEKNHTRPLARLRDLWIKLILDLDNDKQKKQTLMLFLMKCDYSGVLAPYKKIHCQKKAENKQLFKRYIEQAISVGELPSNTDTELLTEYISCFIKGIVVEYLDDPESFDVKNKAPQLIQLFFKQFKTKEHSAFD